MPITFLLIVFMFNLFMFWEKKKWRMSMWSAFLLDKLIHTGVVVHKVRQAYPSLIYCLHTYHLFGFFDHWCAVIRQIWHGWMALLVAESSFCLMKCSNCGGNVLGWQTRNFLPSLYFHTVCVSNNTEHSNNFMLWTCGIVQQFSWLLTDILASTWKLYAHYPSFYIWIFVSSLCLVVDSQVGTY